MVITVASAPVRVRLLLPTGPVLEGTAVPVRVLGVADRDVVVRAVQVELVRRETWRYREGNLFGGAITVPARGEAVVDQVEHPGPGPVAAAGDIDVRTSLLLPPVCLASGAGRLVEVEWRVRAHVHVQGHPPAQATALVTVASRATDRAEVLGAEPVVRDRGVAVLHVGQLSSRRLVPGTMLTGVVVVDPWWRFAVTGARVQLVLREHVHHGRYVFADATKNPDTEQREHETVVASAALSGSAVLEPGHPVELPFGLPVPGRIVLASMDTPEFTVRWLLRAALPRRLRPAPTLDLELLAGTADAPSG